MVHDCGRDGIYASSDIRLLAVGVTPAYHLAHGEADLPPSVHGHVAVEANATAAARPFDAAHPLPLTSRGEWDFQLWTVAPRGRNGWALLGEAATKWVGVSRARVVSVDADDGAGGGLLVRCRGASGERIQLLAVPPGATRTVSVSHTFEAAGLAVVRAHPVASG